MIDDFTPWQKWLTADNIHLEQPPIEITSFQKLLIINIFRYEKTVYAIDEFIRTSLGERFSSPIVPTMDIVYNDKIKTYLFILQLHQILYLCLMK